MSDEKDMVVCTPRTDLAMIRARATTINMVHESCYRSWEIVRKIKELLEYRCPPEVILEIIEDLQAADNVDRQL